MLSTEELEYLERLVASPTAENREVRRARVLLLAAEGVGTTEIAQRVGVVAQTVSKTKRQFRKLGLAAVSDMPRSGRPRTVTDEVVKRVVELTLESQPEGATHWSTRQLAKKTGLSQSTVARIWRAFNLKPHRQDTFELSNDPHFIEKVHDVVGLYISPPTNAVVLSVDEKTQIQALERTQTVLPLGMGHKALKSPKYRRQRLAGPETFRTTAAERGAAGRHPRGAPGLQGHLWLSSNPCPPSGSGSLGKQGTSRPIDASGWALWRHAQEALPHDTPGPWGATSPRPWWTWLSKLRLPTSCG